MHLMKIIPVIAVVYKSRDGNWRGFCYPYDLTCNADTKESAKKFIEDLIDVYEKNLERYNNPLHLIDKKLSESEDQAVLKRIWPRVSRQIAHHSQKAHSPAQYFSYLSSNKELKTGPNESVVSYSHKTLSLAGSNK